MLRLLRLWAMRNHRARVRSLEAERALLIDRVQQVLRERDRAFRGWRQALCVAREALDEAKVLRTQLAISRLRGADSIGETAGSA